MSLHTTFAVPTYQGARLRELAKRSGRTAGSILADLIDDACEAAGVGVQSRAITIHHREHTSTYAATLFEAFQVELSSDGLASLADALTKIADAGGGTHDVDHGFEVYRQGSGVILRIDALSLKTAKRIAAHPSMSPDIARAVANAMREAIAK